MLTLNHNKLPPGLLTKRDVAHFLRVSIRKIERLKKDMKIPSPSYIGRSPRWRAEVIQQWFDNGCPPTESKYEA